MKEKLVLVQLLFWAFSYCFASNISKTIKVNFSKKTLTVEINNKEKEAEFLVALPQKDPKLPVHGKVIKVVLDPVWHPTDQTRKAYYLKKKIELPKVIPPRHPLNALGIGAIYIDWEEGFNPLIRIHGTNDPKSIGQRITRGCIRLKNEDFLKLKDLIQGYETFVVFE